jgi:ABC-2 type transport system ATP-binding protein
VTVPVIELDGVRKVYRSRKGGPKVALDGLDLTVPDGGVFGFLGPNGAGKTTTIRCILGLVALTSGRCRVLGAPSPDGLPDVIAQIGALVEGPGMVPGLSGRANLVVLASMYGIPRSRVDALLEELGLADAADEAARTYSQGMLQRLGVAAALLKDSRLLVLDEPANGLDPAGIKDMRRLLRRLAGEGRTVFLSSHLLAEVQQACDRVAIIDRGRCLVTGPTEEVLRAGRPEVLVVRVADVAAGVGALRSAGFSAAVEDGTIAVELPDGDAERVTRTLVAADLYPTELRPLDLTLERVFLELTSGQER